MIIVLIASVIMGLSDCRLKGFMTFDAGSLEGCCVVKDLVIRKARVLPDMRMVFGGSILCFLKDNASQTSIDLFVRISCNSFSSVFMNKNLNNLKTIMMIANLICLTSACSLKVDVKLVPISCGEVL